MISALPDSRKPTGQFSETSPDISLRGALPVRDILLCFLRRMPESNPPTLPSHVLTTPNVPLPTSNYDLAPKLAVFDDNLPVDRAIEILAYPPHPIFLSTEDHTLTATHNAFREHPPFGSAVDSPDLFPDPNPPAPP